MHLQDRHEHSPVGISIQSAFSTEKGKTKALICVQQTIVRQISTLKANQKGSDITATPYYLVGNTLIRDLVMLSPIVATLS